MTAHNSSFDITEQSGPCAVIAAPAIEIVTHRDRNWGRSRPEDSRKMNGHPGTEAEPSMELPSPCHSVVRGAAAASVVTRTKNTSVIPFGRMLSCRLPVPGCLVQYRRSIR